MSSAAILSFPKPVTASIAANLVTRSSPDHHVSGRAVYPPGRRRYDFDRDASGEARARLTLYAAFHLIEQPIEATCSRGPCSRLRHRFHRLVEIAAGIGDGLRSRCIEAAAILQFVLRVEAEEIRRAHRTIGARDRLAFIVEIREDEAVADREILHVVEGILRILLCIVGRDRHDADTPISCRSLASRTSLAVTAFT